MKAVKKAKEDWIGAQCQEIETYLNKNKNNSAYLLVKDLTSKKQGRSVNVHYRFGKCSTKNMRFSADGLYNAQNRTTMRVVVTTHHWTAVSPKIRSAIDSL